MKTGILLPDYSARTLIQYTQGKQENDKNLNSVFNGFSKQTLNMITGTAAYKSWPFEGKKQTNQNNPYAGYSQSPRVRQ